MKKGCITSFISHNAGHVDISDVNRADARRLYLAARSARAFEKWHLCGKKTKQMNDNKTVSFLSEGVDYENWCAMEQVNPSLVSHRHVAFLSLANEI